MNTVISVKDLYKTYRETKAVNGISFQVQEGRDLRHGRPQRGRQNHNH